jgi:hypothetical protein
LNNCFSFLKLLIAKGSIVMVAIDHLKNARLIGPANCMEYLETIKLPDQMIQAITASKVPN